MKYLVSKTVKTYERRGFKKYWKLPRVLYVADTHTYDMKYRQQMSLTDLREYAQTFTIEEASKFIKKHDGFVIEEQSGKIYNDEENTEYNMEEYENE